MKKVYKKSQLIREGYLRGLREGKRVIEKMIRESLSVTDSEEDEAIVDFILMDAQCGAASRGCAFIGEDGEIIELAQQFCQTPECLKIKELGNCLHTDGDEVEITPNGKEAIREGWRRFMISQR